ncbi:hypothetical protein [Nonomuraea typhae]|uniref:Baseplate protein J-like domain-containing protein n=1 Tax=Nonomuraea typhae TaxID=2603600 RepID=A0ABW7YJ24_9ACTN
MDQQIIHNLNVPAAPLLPPNGQGVGDPMAAFYRGHDPFSDATHAAEDPTVMAQVQAALAESVQHTTIGDYEPDYVKLPIPVVIGDRTYTGARVRELNGGDEEELGRTAASGEPELVLNTLLKCGVVCFGDHIPNAGDIAQLAVPNRDALILGIRRATYGNELKFERLGCTHCDELMELIYDLDDVPSGPALTADNVDGIKVSLRRGGYAVVRFPSGDDQTAILAEIRARNITRAEQDSILLSRVLIQLVDSRGDHMTMTNELAVARSMSIPDRTTILTALDEQRPGPLMDAAKIVCTGCEKETEVPLSVEVLFRG